VTIYFKDVPKVIPDNERSYFNLLEGVLNTVDELSTMEVRKNLSNYSFRIAISNPVYLSLIIDKLNELHSMLNTRLVYSKSIKNLSAISFTVPIF